VNALVERKIVVEEVRIQPVEDMRVELVERKGLGHPDYIADASAEATSRALCEYYLRNYGLILHHNLDKVLVVGGQANPVFGGGEVLEPIYIIVSGRATTSVRTDKGIEPVPVGTLIIKAVRNWIRSCFRYLDPEADVVVDYKIGMGSKDLRELFSIKAKAPAANDTSIGVGYAPLSKLEQLVLSTERMLNSREFKAKLPAVGEDVKVMGLRLDKRIELTVAAAIVSRHVLDIGEYISVKEEVIESILDNASKVAPEYSVKAYVNTADIVERGSVYITVTGTSAEHGDDGMTGRGNRANGLITPMRPMSMEATAGKNPVNHVGKIYNVVATLIANRIYNEVKNVREVYVKLLSQIGKPIDEPFMANVKVLPEGDRLSSNTISEIESIVDWELSNIVKITDKILRNEVILF